MTKRFKLTSEQRRAARTQERYVALIAGPGTGKTRVIVERVRYLTNKLSVAPEAIVALAFGTKAAGELKSRLRANGTIAGVIPQTIHSFAYGLLYPALEPFEHRVEPVKAYKLLGTVLEMNADLPIEPRHVRQIISFARNSGLGIEAAVEQRFGRYCAYIEKIMTIAALYARAKEREKVWDYDDLIEKATVHLRSLVKQGKFLPYEHVIVDEYHDVNVAQRNLINALVNAVPALKRNMFVVGDPAQTINSFAGVDPKWLSQFYADWNGVERLQLSLNHRSTQEILNLVVAVEKPLDLSRKLKSSKARRGVAPVLKEFLTQKHEAVGIINRIQSMVGKGHRPQDIAILARHGHEQNIVRRIAEDRGIPVLVSSHENLLDSEHVQDVLAVFQLHQNCQDRDAFMRCFMLFPGMRRLTAAKLIAKLSESHSTSQLLRKLARNKLSEFGHLAALVGCLRIVRAGDKTLTEKLDAVTTLLKPLIVKKYHRGWNTISNDFRRLKVLAEGLSFKQLQNELELQKATHRSEVDLNDSCIVLSTIHAAKGLEWKSVFVLGLNEGLIPSDKAMGKEQLEEERRILFVALSRAKKRLYMTRFLFAYGRQTSLSRFLRDKAVESSFKRIPVKKAA